MPKNKFLSRATAIVVIGPRQIGKPNRYNQICEIKLQQRSFCATVLDPQGPSMKYVTLFLANFDTPSRATLCHTSRNPSHKERHISEHPPKDCLASCTSVLCKERAYKYRITVVLHCILTLIFHKSTTN